MTEVQALLEMEARRISAAQDALQVTFIQGRRRRRRERLLIAVFALALAVGGLAGAFIAFHHAGTVNPADMAGSQTPRRAHETGPNPFVQTMTVSVDGTTLTVSGSPSPDGYCLTVSGGGGHLGGCGTSKGPFRFGEGGLRVDGQLYNVAYGRAPADASSMEVVLGDGSTLREDASSGVWLFVVAAKAGDRASDFATVKAEDDAGRVLSQVHPPSLSEARNNARRLKTGMATTNGPR
jgi:hypothetical protein